MLQILLLIIAIAGLVTGKLTLRSGYEISGKPVLFLSLFYLVIVGVSIPFHVSDSLLIILVAGTICIGLFARPRPPSVAKEADVPISGIKNELSKTASSQSGGSVVVLPGGSMSHWLSQWQAYRWFKPIAVVCALLAGFALTRLILRLELAATPNLEGMLSAQGFVIAAAIEQLLLGIVALLFFLSSRSPFIAFWVYLGFTLAHMPLINLPNSHFADATVVFAFLPLLLYLVTGVLLSLGFRFFKVFGLLFLLLNVVLVANYNNRHWNGHFISL